MILLVGLTSHAGGVSSLFVNFRSDQARVDFEGSFFVSGLHLTFTAVS